MITKKQQQQNTDTMVPAGCERANLYQGGKGKRTAHLYNIGWMEYRHIPTDTFINKTVIIRDSHKECFMHTHLLPVPGAAVEEEMAVEFRCVVE